ncbi:hypothetical protein GE061_001701, partial [Apolygus lucorum]
MSSVWKEEPMDPQPDQEDFPQQPDVQEEPSLQPQMDILMRPIQQLLGIQSELISKIMTQKIKLAPYDGTTTDPEAWLKAANLIVQKYKPDIADLTVALMEALKGNASLWLSSVIDDNLTWERFQLLFTQKCCRKYTPAATVYRLVSDYFREDIEDKLIEHYPRIRNAFKNRTSDQCADLLIAAVAGRAEPEMRKWIFKEENPNEVSIFQELASIKATKPRTNTIRSLQKGPTPSTSGCKQNNSKFLKMEPLFDKLVSSLVEYKLYQANINIEEDIKEASEEATTPGSNDPETRIPSSRRGWTSADLTLPENSPIE